VVDVSKENASTFESFLKWGPLTAITNEGTNPLIIDDEESTDSAFTDPWQQRAKRDRPGAVSEGANVTFPGQF